MLMSGQDINVLVNIAQNCISTKSLAWTLHLLERKIKYLNKDIHFIFAISSQIFKKKNKGKYKEIIMVSNYREK